MSTCEQPSGPPSAAPSRRALSPSSGVSTSAAIRGPGSRQHSPPVASEGSNATFACSTEIAATRAGDSAISARTRMSWITPAVCRSLAIGTRPRLRTSTIVPLASGAVRPRAARATRRACACARGRRSPRAPWRECPRRRSAVARSRRLRHLRGPRAGVAELADAMALEAIVREGVQVRILSPAPRSPGSPPRPL